MLETRSDFDGLQQIFTGFSTLARNGAISLTERIRRSNTSAASDWILTASVNGRRVIYDVWDREDIDERHLEHADIYFKRAFTNRYVADLGTRGRKVRPLGLNYEVYPDFLDLAGARRNFLVRRGLRRFSGALAALDLRGGFTPRQSALERSAADRDESGRVLFLTQAWDPNDPPWRDRATRLQREEVNEMRAGCIERLRREFGARVLTGFANTEFAARRYPSLLVANEGLTEKRNYLSIVRRCEICVTTTGLHDSNGWKLGEYVAFGKAIVSEQLKHVVPGGFAQGKNYLPFSTADECAQAVDTLLSKPELRDEMKRTNLDYYHKHVRPDRLVLNTLRAALRDSDPAIQDVTAALLDQRDLAWLPPS
jgi:hypothetical protein